MLLQEEASSNLHFSSLSAVFFVMVYIYHCVLYKVIPSVSKPIAVVEGLRNQGLRSDEAKRRTSVSGPTNFRLAFFLFLALLLLVSSIFSS